MASDREQGTERPAFLDREPVALRFGTSGLRGLVQDITDLEAQINTRGFLRYLRETEARPTGGTVELAGDLRESTERILRSVAHAARAEDFAVEYLGRIPTPALALHALRRGRPSIMVTGSHIPADRNGIKFNRPDGEVLKEDETGILSAVGRVRRSLYDDPGTGRLFDRAGMLREPGSLPDPVHSGSEEYRRRYLDFFGPDALAGARVVVYQHSAVGRDLLVELLAELGARPIPVGRSDRFEPIDTENLTPDRAAFFRELVKEHPGCAALVSTDGDSDRPLLADETGVAQGGDTLGAIVARFLGARFAAVPISTSDAVDLFLAPAGVTLVRTKIGSPYVIEAMNRALAGGASGVVGWEANGGFLTGSRLSDQGRSLDPLPTRDALLPLLAALVAARQAGTTLSGLFATLPRRFARAGLLDAFPNETGRALLGRFSPHSSRDLLVAELETFFPASSGFGAIEALDLLDGLRITFVGGDIAHLRPSGNAPQMRLYAVSDTPERAEEILRLGLAEPDGILRRMERAVVGEAGELDDSPRERE